jgi:hypothetical protein
MDGTALRTSRFRERWGFPLLIAASAIVAVAIMADGQVARTVNGIGGLLWIAAAAKIVSALRKDAQFARKLLMCGALTLTLVLVSKPSDYLSAVIGFGLAGAVVASSIRPQSVAWAQVVPAIWLPVHLGVAVAKAVDRAVRDLPNHVRTEPPPTSAFVPMAMVLAAWIGALVAVELRGRRRSASKQAAVLGD